VTGPRVGLVVVDFRSSGLVDQLLQGATGGADEVVVVDCTPADPGLPDVCARHGAALVEPGANLGYGGGANAGVAALRSPVDVVVVANPDVAVSAPALRRLADAAVGRGLVAPRFTHGDGSLQRSAHRGEPGALVTAFDLSVPFAAVARRVRPGWHPTLLPEADHVRSVPCRHVLGALLVVDAAAFRAVGGFDPAFFLYREETDLCHRLRDAGFAVVHEGPVIAVHHGGGSSERDGPLAASPVHLASHHRYVRRWRSRPYAWWCRAVGLVAASTSVVTGPDRRAWLGAVRWHLGRR
jgi:GT2 family glycosyltransferase